MNTVPHHKYLPFVGALLALLGLCLLAPIVRADYAPTEYRHLTQAEYSRAVIDAWARGAKFHVAGTTGSMRPKITGGECVLDEPYDGKSRLPIGALVTFDAVGIRGWDAMHGYQPRRWCNGAELIEHEVTADLGWAVITKGTHNERSDGIIPKKFIRSVAPVVLKVVYPPIRPAAH